MTGENRWALPGLVLLGLALRVYGAARAGLTFDESIVWAFAREIHLRPVLHLVSRTADHPLLNAYLARASSVAFGESDLADMTLEVIDTTPPTLALSLNPSVLWPPNHRIVPVHASVTASDRCGESRVILTSVSSDQPDEGLGIGDGNFPHDIQNADSGQPDFDVSLRAERDRGSGGRIYTLVYTARDESGNAASVPASVRVPRG